MSEDKKGFCSFCEFRTTKLTQIGSKSYCLICRLTLKPTTHDTHKIIAAYSIQQQIMINKIITKSETERIERVLASDEMEGRRTFSPSIDKAAAFIAKEFEASGLKSLKGDNNFLQSFSINRPKFISLSASIDGSVIDNKQVIVVTIEPEIKITEANGYTVAKIAAGENLNQLAAKMIGANQKMIVLVDESHAQNFGRLVRFKNNLASSIAFCIK